MIVRGIKVVELSEDTLLFFIRGAQISGDYAFRKTDVMFPKTNEYFPAFKTMPSAFLPKGLMFQQKG